MVGLYLQILYFSDETQTRFNIFNVGDDKRTTIFFRQSSIPMVLPFSSHKAPIVR